jgi:hypothetical protein
MNPVLKTQLLTDDAWQRVLEQVNLDLRGQPWANDAGYVAAFWHFDADLLAKRIGPKRISIPADVQILGAPIEGILEIAICLLVRLLPPAMLRVSKFTDIVSKSNLAMVGMLILRGEAFCQNVIRFLDDCRVLGRRIPGCTDTWAADARGRVMIPANLAKAVELVWQMQRNGRGVALAAFDEMYEGRMASSKLSMPYFMEVVLRMLLTEQMTHSRRLPQANEGWKVNLLLQWGLPGGVELPTQIRFGWIPPSHPHREGFRLVSITDAGQLVYENKRNGQRLAEGQTMSIDPRVAAWGPNIKIMINSQNAAYLTGHMANPPARCPWAWYEAWGPGQYTRKSRGLDGAPLVWQEDQP